MDTCVTCVCDVCEYRYVLPPAGRHSASEPVAVSRRPHHVLPGWRSSHQSHDLQRQHLQQVSQQRVSRVGSEPLTPCLLQVCGGSGRPGARQRPVLLGDRGGWERRVPRWRGVWGHTAKFLPGREQHILVHETHPHAIQVCPLAEPQQTVQTSAFLLEYGEKY